MRSFPVLAALFGIGLASVALAQQPDPAAPQPAQPAPPAEPAPPPTQPAAPAPPAPAPPAQPAPAPAPAPAQPKPAQPAAQPKPAQPAAQPKPAQPAAQPAPAPAPSTAPQPAEAQPAAGQPAQPAQPKAAPPPVAKPGKVTSACPGKLLPLAVGNTWTYESVEARDSKGQPVFPPEGMTKLLPLRATKVVVTVTSVEPNKAEPAKQETTVKLKETITYDITKDPKTPKLFDQVVESTIVCSKKGRFDISPESFFFAGEPGGYRGINFSKFERKKETTLKLTNNTIGERAWIEEIIAEYQKEATKGSGAKLGGGKLEMERKFTPQPPEGVATRNATYRTTEKIGITTSGRIMLDTKVAPDGKPCTRKEEVAVAAEKKAEPAKPGEAKAPEEKRIIDVPTEVCELPANWISQIWLADGFGLVQALNPYAHMYQLVEAKLH